MLVIIRLNIAFDNLLGFIEISLRRPNAFGLQTLGESLNLSVVLGISHPCP